MTAATHKIGIIGLGVMGLSLARNISSKGFSVIGYDTQDNSRERARGHDIDTTESINAFVNSLESPRRILIMVPAGEPVDAVLADITPLLSSGDSVVDGGNSFFKDTTRREQELQHKGIHYLGLGVSGGRRGALEGPGMMAGGSEKAYTLWREVLEAIAAKFEGEPCVRYLGPGGAGHYVKMVHNGIEYGMMQLLAEAYLILKIAGRRNNEELAGIFSNWDKGELGGYLTGITAEIFLKKDPSGAYWIDNIKDAASQKGTGNWTVQNALEIGIPIPAIEVAVRQRMISSLFQERSTIKADLKTQQSRATIKLKHIEEGVEKAVHVSQLLVYLQGLHLLAKGKEAYSFSYQLKEICEIWRNGCIISSNSVQFLSQSLPETTRNPFFVPVLSEMITSGIGSLRSVLSYTEPFNLALPCMNANLNFWRSLTNIDMPTNLIQAQRDYFGGHGLELKSGEKTSLDWEGTTSQKPDSD